MPERPVDPNTNWLRKGRYPGADYTNDAVEVQEPFLVDSIGTDGRFTGSIRPFPGFADETVHGLADMDSDEVDISGSGSYVWNELAGYSHTTFFRS